MFICTLAVILSTNVHIRVPLDLKPVPSSYIGLDLRNGERLIDGSLDRPSRIAFAIVEGDDVRSLLVSDGLSQSRIEPLPGQWASVPYRVGKDYCIATGSPRKSPVFEHLISNGKLLEKQEFANVFVLARLRDPSRRKDKRAFDLMLKYCAGLPAWNIDFSDTVEHEYLASIPTVRFPLSYNSDESVVLRPFQFLTLVEPLCANGLEKLLPDKNYIDTNATCVSAVVKNANVAFTYEYKERTSESWTYASAVGTINSKNVEVEWLGKGLFVFRDIVSFDIAR